MRGILILLGLLSITIATPKLITTKDAIINQMISNRASNQEKASVFSQLKTLITSSPTTVFKINLDGLIETGNIYTYPAVIGGKVGEEAIETLRNTYNISAKPEKVLEFLRISLDFMRNGVAPDHVQWLFFHDASKFLLSLDMDYIRKMLVKRVWKVPNELLNALGIVEESTTTTTTTTTTEVYHKPVGEYELDLSADAIANLTRYWKENPVLNDGILIKMLENSRHMEIIDEAKRLMSIFQNSRNLSLDQTEVFHYFKERFDFDPNFDQNFELMMNFRDFDFELVAKTLIKFQSDSKTKKEKFIRLLNETESLQSFFKRVQDNRLYDAPLYLENLEKLILFEIKKFSVKQIEVLMDAIKKWKNLDDETKTTAEKLMSYNITEDECLGIWSKGMVEGKMYDLVQLVDSMDNELGLKSCFFLNRTNFININDLTELIGYWKQNHVLSEEKFNKILELIENGSYESFKNIEIMLQLLDVSELSEKSIMQLFGILEESQLFEFPLAQLFEDALKLKNVDLRIISKINKEFNKLNESEKVQFVKEISKVGGDNKGLESFFKNVLVPHSSYVYSYLEDLQKIISYMKKFSEERMNALTEILMEYPYISSDARLSIVDFLSNKLSKEECEKFKNQAIYVRSFRVSVDIMKMMDKHWKTKSCFSQ